VLQNTIDHPGHLLGIGHALQTLDFVSVGIIDHEVHLVVNTVPTQRVERRAAKVGIIGASLEADTPAFFNRVLSWPVPSGYRPHHAAHLRRDFPLKSTTRTR